MGTARTRIACNQNAVPQMNRVHRRITFAMFAILSLEEYLGNPVGERTSLTAELPSHKKPWFLDS
jgi:hypothetical protein